MFQKSMYSGDKEKDYMFLLQQLEALLEGEENRIANLSNAAALLNHFLEDINWVGFYLMDELKQELVLGPFQGLPACVRIPIGKGVCGTSVKERRSIRVEDVHQFPGHIACDAATNSEIVIPLLREEEIIGVLDIDSPTKARFDELDQAYLEKFVTTLMKYM